MERLDVQQNFYDYCKEKNASNIYDITDTPDTLSGFNNSHLLYYGAKGIGKYSQALFNIQKYSPTQLKYERKLIVNYDKQEYIIMMSDVHFEIDMELLGCNSKSLFLEIIKNIQDIVQTRSNKIAIVLCKNFHLIHNELLESFYSYMSQMNQSYTLLYHIITENICFIPDNIINISKTFQLSLPSKTIMQKNVKSIPKKYDISTMKNLKIIQNENNIETLEYKIQNCIIHQIIDFKNLNMGHFRDVIYDMLIYNIDVHECIGNIVLYLFKNNYILEKDYYDIMIHIYKAFKQYNNNYRPIYHLENIYYYLVTCVHGNKNEK